MAVIGARSLLLPALLIITGCVRLGFDLTEGTPDGATATDGSVDQALLPDRTVSDGAPDRDIAAVEDGGADSHSVPVPGTWSSITPGEFTMGSSPDDPCGGGAIQHTVTLTRSFAIQTTEVTQAQFQALMGYNPSVLAACGGSCPVENVSWHEAAAYCNALSSLTNLAPCYACQGTDDQVRCDNAPAFAAGAIYTCPGCRLATEAEWEYAYRAGTTTSTYNGTVTVCYGADPTADAIAWYWRNSGADLSTTRPVAQKKPNDWGLYDMGGNVEEWVNDWHINFIDASDAVDPWGASFYAGGKTVRGGSWRGNAQHVTAANRYSVSVDSRHDDIGFRCVRTLLP